MDTQRETETRDVSRNCICRGVAKRSKGQDASSGYLPAQSLQAVSKGLYLWTVWLSGLELVRVERRNVAGLVSAPQLQRERPGRAGD